MRNNIKVKKQGTQHLSTPGNVTLQMQFGINADYLCTLSDVMNAYNGVAMEWKSNQMLVVTPIGEYRDIKGIIMTKMV